MLGLPTIHDRRGHWDPLMAACEETETVVCMHIGSSSRRLHDVGRVAHARDHVVGAPAHDRRAR